MVCFFFFSLKTCRLQLQNPQLDSHNLHGWNGLIWYLFQTFQLHDLMTQCARRCCTSTVYVFLCSDIFCFYLHVCVCFPVCVCVCENRHFCVFVWGVGNRFERALSVSSAASWSSVAGCGLVCTGWRRTESGKESEMIPIKEIVGCLSHLLM